MFVWGSKHPIPQITASFSVFLYSPQIPAALICLPSLDLATSPEFVWFSLPSFVASVAQLCPSEEFGPEQIKSLELIQTEWYKRRHSCQLCPLSKGVRIRDSNGISELLLIQLILPYKIRCIRGSLDIPLQSQGENKLYQRGHFNLEKQHIDNE